MDAELDSFEVFPWNSNFETGIAIIDEQHRRLVDLLNEMTGALINIDEAELKRIFDELTAYAHYHFSTEERVWAPYFPNDSWLLKHQNSHASFIPEVIKLREELSDRPYREVIEHVLQFLIRWLAFHIIDSDKRMALVIKHLESGASMTEAKSLSNKAMSNSARVLMDTVMLMYEKLTSRTMDLMRERVQRKKVEAQLSEANHELKKLAITDQLTGLLNRRQFELVFLTEIRRARREKRCLTLLMVDIDHFKRLNDRYGHLVGDQALQKVARCLQFLCHRAGDYVFRLGGEEFAILIADQRADSSNHLSEKIRLEVENLQIENLDSDVLPTLTISIGEFSRVPQYSDSMESFIQGADIMLYQAKSEGRNRVVRDD